MVIRDEILTRRQAAEDYLSTKRSQWDVYEDLFHNKLADAMSSSTKSQVFDPKLSTLMLDRSYRVMAQLPTGKIRGISRNDRGVSFLMNLILDKYVFPNANAQFDFLTKLRMVDLYSNIYGNFFTLVDWDVKKNGYVGPDIWLLNIRDVFPQVGAVSLEDSDYVIIRTWKPLSYFEGLRKQDGFKNISEIVAKLKDKTGSKQARSDNDKGKRESSAYPTGEAAKRKGYFEVLSQFEGDRWVDFCVDAEMVFRDIKNSHDNGELPVTCKYSIPLLDDFMGMGDSERGQSMQQTINSVWNLYLDACKMSIFPPILINQDNIASFSSIQWGAAAKWLVRGQLGNTISPVNLNPQGIATFNNTYQVANASLLNLFGTSDTTTTQSTDPNFGRTPQALRMQAARENARDSADRFYMERYLTSTIKKMINLLSKNQSSAITIRMFGDELPALERSYPEIKEMFDESTGKLMIDKKITGSNLFDYEIVPGSTFTVDQQQQQQNLTQMLDLLVRQPQLIQAIDQEGYRLKLGEMFKRIVSNSGIQDWDKILEEKTEKEKVDSIIQQNMAQFQAAVQAQGSLGQIPPQPNEEQPIA